MKIKNYLVLESTLQLGELHLEHKQLVCKIDDEFDEHSSLNMEYATNDESNKTLKSIKWNQKPCIHHKEISDKIHDEIPKCERMSFIVSKIFCIRVN
jgi:hypothetical protein